MAIHPTTMKAASALVNNDKVIDLMDQLEARWADESAYEDINEYGALLAKVLPEGVAFVRMSKRPFGPVVQLPLASRPIVLYLKRKRGGWCLALTPVGSGVGGAA